MSASGPTLQEQAAPTSANICAARSESPPRRKKSSSRAIGETASSPLQIAASRASNGSRSAASSLGRPEVMFRISAMRARCGLAVRVFGISLTNTIRRGILNSARSAAAKRLNPGAVGACSGHGTTAAPTSSPSRLCG